MIRTLKIQNYILIEELIVDFYEGFSTITGETGSGKSIIIEAISLLLGKRADSDVLLDKNKKCIIEAEFNTSNQSLNDYIVEKEIDQSEIIILRREILPQAKSRAFVNDTPVNLNVLKEIAEKLIDLHSQYENLSIALNNYRLKIIDIAAGTINLYKEYILKYNKYINHKNELSKLEIKLSEKIRDIDYYRFQYDQLTNAGLTDDNELEYLEEKSIMLENASEIKENLLKAANIIDGDEYSIDALLKEVKILIAKLTGKYPKASEILERLEIILFELRDIVSVILKDGEESDVNPELQEKINQRIDHINSLLQKHRVETIYKLKEKAKEYLSYLTGTQELEENITEIKNLLQAEYNELNSIAIVLSNKREKVFQEFESKITESLKSLGIKDAVFEIENKKSNELTIHGIDNLEFLFSANKNFSPQPLDKVASGGEFSRLMLALKTYIIKASEVDTVVFDEIDSGVSGEIAFKMGKLMKQLSKDVQVISITHLPQIAAMGDKHYKVFKSTHDQITYTGIKKLNEIERVNEIATMIGGDKVSNEAIQAAKVLLGE